MNLTATHINYFFTCKRKLWLFSRNIKCEQESDFVKIGKIHHEDFEKESIEIDNIKIDKLIIIIGSSLPFFFEVIDNCIMLFKPEQTFIYS